MGGNVSISRNRTKIERLLDWKKFPSKSVGRFSFQCLTVLCLHFDVQKSIFFLLKCNFNPFKGPSPLRKLSIRENAVAQWKSAPRAVRLKLATLQSPD